MKFLLKQLKRIFSACSIALILTVPFLLTAPEPALASAPGNSSLSQPHNRVLSNEQQLLDASRLPVVTIDRFCKAYLDRAHSGVDNSAQMAIKEGVASTVIIVHAINSASAAGGGSLAGYAGMASAVSHLGLGGLTTTIAAAMGSHATGAAATAVVTSAVGGPMVMGTLIALGTGAAAFGTYELGKWTFDTLGHQAESYCVLWYKRAEP